MKGHPLSDEQIKAILRLYDEDCSTQEIAARVGVDISTVQKRLVRAGKAPPSQRLTQEKREKIFRMFKDGQSVQEICEEVGCSDSTVRHWLEIVGLRKKGRKRGKPPASTLCWDCRYAGKGSVSPCPWVRCFKPRSDWDAVRRDIPTDHGKTESYFVCSCPAFVKG